MLNLHKKTLIASEHREYESKTLKNVLFGDFMFFLSFYAFSERMKFINNKITYDIFDVQMHQKLKKVHFP